jgi:alkylhydroperoxidase family enzyme
VSRIAPLSPPFADDVATTLARMTRPGAEPIALFRLFGRNPTMADAMTGWGRYELGRALSLTRRDREIVIDRTCARCGCEYEWGVHVGYFAAKVGFTTDQVTSLTHGRAADPCWTDERDRLLIEAADALHDNQDIDDALWHRLATIFDDAQLIDLLLLAGWYHAISYAARGTRLPSEPGTPSFTDFAPRPIGSGI